MIRLLGICILCLMVAVQPALAQQCNAAYEVVSKISRPDFGAYNISEIIYGEIPVTERFVAGMTDADNNRIAAGHRYKDKGDEVALILAKFDRRGRVLWEKEHDIKGLEEVTTMLPHGDGFLLLGNKHGEVWLGFFKADGELKRQKILKDNKFDLTARDIIRGIDGKSLVLAAHAEGKGYAATGYGMIYMLDASGNPLRDRVYLPGIENDILSLAVQDGAFYVAAGHVEAANGLQAGWVLKLDEEAKLIWQRQYSRGAAAQINTIVDYIDDFIVVGGRSVPIGSGNLGAWIMVLDGDNGNVGWQRFYTGTYDHYVRNIITHDDRQITTLIDGVRRDGSRPNIKDGEEPEYAMLLTLSPRGVVLERNTYYQGEGVGAYDVFLGNNSERIMVGYADMKYQKGQEDDPDAEFNVERSREGWILAGAPAEPYNDPCVPEKPYIP